MRFNVLKNGDLQIKADMGAGVNISLTLSKQDINELKYVLDRQDCIETAKTYADQYLQDLPIPEKKRHAANAVEAHPDQIERIADKFCETRSKDVSDDITWTRAANDVMLAYLTNEWVCELAYDMWNTGLSEKEVINTFNKRGYEDPDLSDDLAPSELADYLKEIILNRKISIRRLLEVMLDTVWR